MPDLLNLQSGIQKINSETLPEAAKLANDTIQNAARLIDGSVNNGAVLLAQLLQGVEGERMLAFDNAQKLLEPIIRQWSRTNDELEKINRFLVRLRLTDG